MPLNFTLIATDGHTMKNLLLSLTVLLLAACVSSTASAPQDNRNPWDRGQNQQAALSAPDTLDLRQQWLTGSEEPESRNTQFEIGTDAAAPVPGISGAPVTRDPLPPAQAQGMTSPTQPAAPVKVALLLPLSGANRAVGESILNAAQLALFDIGGNTFELLPRDTRGTAAGAADAARSAAAEGAQIILGPLFAEEVRAAAPIAAASAINMVAFTTDWKQAGGNTFVMGFMPFGQVQRVIDYAASQNLRRIGIIAPQTEYGNAVINAYHAAAGRAGVSTVDMLRFRPGDTALSDPVQRFARADTRKRPDGSFEPAPFDAVFMPVAGIDAQTIGNLLSYHELDARQVRRLGTGLWDDGALLGETNLNGGWFAAPDPAARRNFESKYRDTYGAPPPRLASLGYDATALAAVLARNAQRGMADAFNRAALTNPNGFAGVDGIFRFRHDGLAERGLAVLEMRNGQAVVIDPAPRTFQNATQ